MKQLLLIGGGHAHMVTLDRLETFIQKGFEVTVIQPAQYHYYSGMGPGMLGGTYKADDIRFATRQLVEKKGGRFVLGKAFRIDPHKQTVSLENTGEELSYDVLSCNAGSYVPKDIIQGDRSRVFTSKPIEELQRARETIVKLSAEKEITIAIIGSGPSAVEIAGNIHQLCNNRQGIVMPKILLLGGKTFMPKSPVSVQQKVRKLLLQKNIEIIESGYVDSIQDNQISCVSGKQYRADVIFPAIGVKPSKIFARSGLPVGPDGGLQVNSHLQSIRYENIFGGGDCIYYADSPLDKVGVYAVRQNEVLYNNLMASLEGRALRSFDPGGKYLLIYNLGEGQGVLSKWWFTIGGKLAFTIKDYIDRKFIKEFK